MQYLAAYLLASLSGKKEPTEADVTKILGATGQKVNEAEVKSVVEKLKGKKIEDLIKNGLGKVGTLTVGGGATGGATTAATPAAPAADKKGGDKKEEKKPAAKEKEPEPKAEDDDFGSGGLFGDDF